MRQRRKCARSVHHDHRVLIDAGDEDSNDRGVIDDVMDDVMADVMDAFGATVRGGNSNCTACFSVSDGSTLSVGSAVSRSPMMRRVCVLLLLR